MGKASLDSPVTIRQFDEFRKDQVKIHSEMLDTILSGMDDLAKNMRKENAEEHTKTRQQIEEVKQELKSTKSHLNDDINGLKADIATAPTRTEFNQLKNRVYSQ